MVVGQQPADDRAISRGDGRRDALQGLRHDPRRTGDMRPQPVERRGDTVAGLLRGRDCRERTYRGLSRGLEHRLCRRAGKLGRLGSADASLRPQDGAAAPRDGLARSHRPDGTSAQVQVRMGQPGRLLSTRLERPVRCGERRLPLDRRGSKLGDDQPGPHTQRPGGEGGDRPDHEHRPVRAVCHLQAGGVERPARGDMGGHQRRAGAADARRRREMGRRDSA